MIRLSCLNVCHHHQHHHHHHHSSRQRAFHMSSEVKDLPDVPVDGEESVGVSKTNTVGHKRKRPAVIKTSKGNKHIQKRQSRLLLRRKKLEVRINRLETLSDMDALGILTRQRNCCTFGKDLGCILRQFQDDESRIRIQDAVHFVKKCRRMTATKSPLEVDEFMYDHYVRGVIPSEHMKGSDPEKIKRLNRSFTLQGGMSSCTKCFLEAYGLSKKRLDKMAILFKENYDTNHVGLKDAVLLQMNHKTFGDDHIHEFNYAQTEEIFRQNLGTEIAGSPVLSQYHRISWCTYPTSCCFRR